MTGVLTVLNMGVVALAVWWLVAYRPTALRWTPTAWMLRFAAVVPMVWALRSLASVSETCDSRQHLVWCWGGELAGTTAAIGLLVAMLWVRHHHGK